MFNWALFNFTALSMNALEARINFKVAPFLDNFVLIYLCSSCPKQHKFVISSEIRLCRLSLWEFMINVWEAVPSDWIENQKWFACTAMNVWQWELMIIFIWSIESTSKRRFKVFPPLFYIWRRKFFLHSWADASAGAWNECKSVQSALLIDCGTRPESTEMMRGHALDSQDYIPTRTHLGQKLHVEMFLCLVARNLC